MNFHIEHSGGKEPGITLSSTRENLRELASQIQKETERLESEEKEEGNISLRNTHVEGDALEWFAIRAVKDVKTLYQEDEQKRKKWIFLAPLIWIVTIAILYLAYRGINDLLN